MSQIEMNKPQKYQIGEHVTVQGWGTHSSGTVKAVEWIYHNRLAEYTWGYFIDWDEGKQNPFTMTYIPQGYLSKESSTITNT